MLLRKRVQVNGTCIVCNEEPETVLHTLVSCPFAVSSRNKSKIAQVSGEFSSFTEWLQLVFLQQQQKDISLIVMICWILWKNMNDLTWNQHSSSCLEVVNAAVSVLSQWNNVQDRSFDPFMGYMSHEDGDEHWSLPQVDSVKVNAYAAIFEELNRYAYAFVIRDNEGKLMEARSKCLQGTASPDMVEAIGIREALSWIKEKGANNAVLESDCLQVVQSIRSSIKYFSYLGRVIQECKDLMSSLSDKNVKFRFIKRSANKVAHYLARHSCSIADRIWRMGDVHPEFNSVMLNDLSVK